MTLSETLGQSCELSALYSQIGLPIVNAEYLKIKYGECKRISASATR